MRSCPRRQTRELSVSFNHESIMKINPALAALFALSLALPSSADTFTLKDGTTLEGTILSEADGIYTLEIQVTKSIKDERKVPKVDVVKIDRERPDEKAFLALGKLTPTPDLWTEGDYANRIREIEKFLKEYPTSLKAKSAKEAVETLKAEAAEVAAGGVKLNGEIVGKDQYQKNAYDLDAKVEEMKIREMLSHNHLLAALRAFSTFEEDFRNTKSYMALLPLIQTAIQSYAGEANQQLESLERRTAARQASVQRMSPESRGPTEAAIREESDAIEARYKKEKDERLKWMTISPFHKQSLDDTVSFGKSELTRLAALPTELAVDAGKAYRELYNAVQNVDDASAVTTAVSAAKTAKVPERYIAPLEDAAKASK